MNADQMREELKKAYSSDSWQKKVEGMSDSQVIAIYKRLKGVGKI